MTRKHDEIFDDVLSGLDASSSVEEERSGARFLKRSTAISDRMSGDLEEKTLRWVDPDRCKMWDRHNRDLELLNEDNCGDLIDGIKSQGRQEFPAIVRPTDDPDFDYEVVCGARRHFAVRWLRNHNYPQFKYLIEVRDLTDEEAFRLADIENRDREDISDYERAVDYFDACERYYGGRQKAMAERLEVSQPWLSRYLQLARLPHEIVQCFPTIRDIKERNARELKPLLADPIASEAIAVEAGRIRAKQQAARRGECGYVDAAIVMRRLLAAAKSKAPASDAAVTYRMGPGAAGLTVKRKGRKTVLEFENGLAREELAANFEAFLRDHFGPKK